MQTLRNILIRAIHSERERERECARLLAIITNIFELLNLTKFSASIWLHLAASLNSMSRHSLAILRTQIETQIERDSDRAPDGVGPAINPINVRSKCSKVALLRSVRH